MQSIMTAVTGTIENGELKADMSLFPEGAKVIVMLKEDWNRFAGSDSLQYQFAQLKAENERLKAGVSE